VLDSFLDAAADSYESKGCRSLLGVLVLLPLPPPLPFVGFVGEEEDLDLLILEDLLLVPPLMHRSRVIVRVHVLDDGGHRHRLIGLFAANGHGHRDVFLLLLATRVVLVPLGGRNGGRFLLLLRGRGSPPPLTRTLSSFLGAAIDMADDNAGCEGEEEPLVDLEDPPRPCCCWSLLSSWLCPRRSKPPSSGGA
jgi:hypothetical protein